MKGKLTLIPTPINVDVPLDQNARTILLNGYEEGGVILVEEHKVARRRWIKEELPREAIEDFILYNEHTFKEAGEVALSKLISGKNVFMMSDCGLPAFCDPGRRLVDSCHNSNITVTAAPFANSIALALALSGMPHNKFMFEGFIPVKQPDRKKSLSSILKSKVTVILMDTPYRLQKLLGEISDIDANATIFLAMNLNSSEEQLLRGKVSEISNKIKNPKSEFILITGPQA